MGVTYHGAHSGIALTSGFAAKDPVTVAGDGTITSGAGYNGDAVYGAHYAWTILNQGTVAASGAGLGVDLRDGGSVSNGVYGAGAALIAGGVAISGGAGYVVNAATILGNVSLQGGGIVLNGLGTTAAGMISGGVTLGGPGTITNRGAIGGISAGGSVFVANFGTLTGGIVLDSTAAAGDTLLNAGLIQAAAGGAPVTFGAGNDLLVLEPGEAMAGSTPTDGGAGKNVLELTTGVGTGVVSGLGALGTTGYGYRNFGTVAVDPGATWLATSSTDASAVQLVNDGTIIVAGATPGGGHLLLGSVGEDTGASGTVQIGGNAAVEVTGSAEAGQTFAFYNGTGRLLLDQPGVFLSAIADFQAGDLMRVGVAANSDTFAGGVLTLANNGAVVAQLTLSAAAANPDFFLTSAGSSGTVVTLGPATLPPPPGNLALAPGSDSSHGHDVTNDTTPVVTGTGQAGDVVTLLDGTLVVGTGTVASNGSFSITSAMLANGAQTLTATESDTTTGLVSTASPGLAITIKTSAPAPSQPQLVGGGTVSNSATPSLTGTGEAGDTVTLFDGTSVVGTGTVGSTGAWTIATAPLAAGTDVLTAVETDIAGNVSSPSAAFDLTVSLQTGSVFSGTYTTGIVLATAAQNPATVTATGNVSNTTTAYGGVALYGAPGVAWTVSNQGKIAGGAAPGAYGVLLMGGPASLDNSGSIGGGVLLADGGSLDNMTGGTIAGLDAVITEAPATLSNAGLIAGGSAGYAFGAFLGQGGAIANLAGSTITAADAAIVFDGPGSIGNQGLIAGTGSNGIGVYIGAGGVSLTNGGNISGQDAVVAGAPATLSNTSVIAGGSSGYGFGVYLAQGGAMDNQAGGTITAADAGIVFNGGPGAIVNHGLIEGTGSNGIGVYVGASGVSLTNAGTISGAGGVAVVLGAGDLLTVDPGAVFIGYVLGNGSDTLELAAGSGGVIGLGGQFQGFSTVKVDPGASWSLTGTGGALDNDGTVAVYGGLSLGAVTHDSGDKGTIDLGNSGVVVFTAAVANGETLKFTDATGTALLDRPLRFKATIDGFGAGDVIDLVGVQANAVAFGGHELVVTENGNAVANLKFAGHFTTGQFSLSPDGSGGTDITLNGPTVANPFWTMKG